MLEEENRLLDLERFLSLTLEALKVISVVQEVLVWVTQSVLEVVCQITIYRGIQLRGVGRRFLLCGGGCTTFLGGILLGLLVYRVFFVLSDGMRGNRTLNGFRTVLTRIYECSEGRP